MQLRYKLNTIYRTLGPLRDGTTIEIAPDHIVYWLGFIERDHARSWKKLLRADQVALSTYAAVHGWRKSELDAWQWIDSSQTFVGFLVPEGVFAVVERGRPLLKLAPAP